MIRGKSYSLINLSGIDIEYLSILLENDGYFYFDIKYDNVSKKIDLDTIEKHYNSLIELSLFNKRIERLNIKLDYEVKFSEHEDILVIISPDEENHFNILDNNEKIEVLKCISKELNIPYYDQISIITPLNITTSTIYHSIESKSDRVIHCISFEIVYKSCLL